MENLKTETTEQKTKTGMLPWILAGGLLGLLVANVFLFQRTQTLESELRTLRAGMQVAVSSLQEADARQNQSTRQALDQLAIQLEQTQQKAGQAANFARSNAQKHAEQLVKQLSEEQRRQQEELDSKIGQFTQAHASTTERVSGLLSDFGNVKTEVGQTRSELEKTIAELRTMRGDLGLQSGLIATNSRELAALKELGQRNYYEFDLTKKSGTARLAGVALALRKTDDKRYKYTLDLIVNDRKVEKKDKYINEPVQFYVPGARQPFEIVVNDVKKDRIIGYLSTPKTFESARR